jgi:phage repressor protein C with HTH and peptisase S24 domain
MKILNVFKMSLEEFTAYPDTPQKAVINIPVYEQAFSAGRGQELPDSADVIDYVALPNELKKYSDKMCAAYVRGDSMEPTLFDNDIIVYDTFGYDGTDGIYAINYRGCAFVKRLQRAKDFVRIISDNKKYNEMTENGESEDFRVIGKVRYVTHKVQG